MNIPEIPYHNLTRIHGIGEARQLILRKALNIRYYQDLAALDLDKALSLFRKKSEAVSQEMLKSWAEEARLLNQELITTKDFIASGYSLGTPESENGWQAFATFIVDYQARSKRKEKEKEKYRTTVHHMQTDTTKTWVGLEKVRYHHWIEQELAKIDDLDIYTNSNQLANEDIYSAIIQGISFKHDRGKNNSATVTSKPLNFTNIELLLFIERLSNDLSRFDKISCKIKCLLQQQGQDTFEEITQTHSLVPAKEAGYFSTAIERLPLKSGDYRLWISVVLNYPNSIPHFKILPHVRVTDDNGLNE